MRFTDAHSPAALCAPSRFSLLTGSYPYRNGKPGGARDVNNPSGFSLNGDRTDAGRHLTVAEVMRKAGYRTAFFGKGHFGGDVYDTDGNLIRNKDKLSTTTTGHCGITRHPSTKAGTGCPSSPGGATARLTDP